MARFFWATLYYSSVCKFIAQCQWNFRFRLQVYGTYLAHYSSVISDNITIKHIAENYILYFNSGGASWTSSQPGHF